MPLQGGLLIKPTAAGSSFTDPTSLPNLAGWWDAADTGSITGTTNASQWNDKSGNTRHFTQSNGSNQPYTNLRTINSLNALLVTGNSGQREYMVTAAFT